MIDDDEAVRESLAFLLRSAGLSVRDLRLGGDASSMRAPKIAAGCIITDVRMPGLSGIDLLRRLQEMQIGLPVIVITGHGDVPLAVEAMKAARSISSRSRSTTTSCWHRCAPRSTARRRARRSRAERAEIAARIAALSQRERQVLEGLVAGQPNKIIAYELEHQPPHRRDLPRQPDDQDEGGQPLRARAHGARR